MWQLFGARQNFKGGPHLGNVSLMKIDNHLPEKLNEYLNLMAVLCDCYDAGHEIVALSISTTIRVLVHDTSNSTSLLLSLGKKDVQYLDTRIIDHDKSINLSLVRQINVGVRDGAGGEAKYWPLCDERYFSTPSHHFKYVSFDAWWDGVVFKNENFSLTRQDLVLTVANKDGGAHFDEKVDEKYDAFRKKWSGGNTLVGRRSGINRGYDNIPTYPAVRQIAYELLQSLNKPQPD